jgi:hypothetical protein
MSDQVDNLQQRIATLEKANRELLKDKERLDWIESQSNGSSCVARMSNTGRGFRLHNTGKDSSDWHLARRNFREAIDVAQALDKAALAKGEPVTFKEVWDRIQENR